MNNFGDVLRGLGSVLNPQVMQAVEAEDQRKQQLQQQFQMLAVKNQMEQQSPEYQARAEALKNERAYREAVSGLNPNAPDYQDQIAGFANQFGKPEIAAAYVRAKEDREARIQTAKEAREERARTAAETLALRQQQLDQTRELALQRAADQRERDAINAHFRQQSLTLQGQIAAANQELRRLGIEGQRQQAQAVQATQLNRQTTQLQAALEKANLPEADAVLGAVESALEKAPNLAEYLAGPKSLQPDLIVPKDIATGRQAFQKLFNITLKNRSGAAVTIPEFERLKAEFGNGAFKTKEQLESALTQARDILSKHYASVAAGFGSDALNAYNENIRQFGGRVVLDGTTTPAAAPAPTPTPSQAPATQAPASSSGWIVKEKKKP